LRTNKKWPTESAKANTTTIANESAKPRDVPREKKVYRTTKTLIVWLTKGSAAAKAGLVDRGQRIVLPETGWKKGVGMEPTSGDRERERTGPDKHICEREKGKRTKNGVDYFRGADETWVWSFHRKSNRTRSLAGRDGLCRGGVMEKPKRRHVSPQGTGLHWGGKERGKDQKR